MLQLGATRCSGFRVHGCSDCEFGVSGIDLRLHDSDLRFKDKGIEFIRAWVLIKATR